MADGHTIKIIGATHAGNVRSHNEDAILTDGKRGLAVVADGMGGHASGEVASRITIDTFTRSFADATSLREILLQAHAAIVACAVAQPESAGMGATAVAALADSEHFQIAWVGDSRAYHWRFGALRQISQDHSYLEFLLRSGAITDAQARNHPQRNVVTQALGLNSPEPDWFEDSWQQGDRLLLCSDGLSDELEDAEIQALLDTNPDIESAAFALVNAALKNGGRDNISVVLIENGVGTSTRSTRALRLWVAMSALLAGIAVAVWWSLRG
jgi:protein phosphatase